MSRDRERDNDQLDDNHSLEKIGASSQSEVVVYLCFVIH